MTSPPRLVIKARSTMGSTFLTIRRTEPIGHRRMERVLEQPADLRQRLAFVEG